MSKILITGGAGAIGSNLVSTLLNEGHEVSVIDDLSSGHRSLLPENVAFFEGSVSDDRVLCEAFETSPEYVIHMAALFANQNSVDNPQQDLEVNGRGTLSVIQKSHEKNVKKLVYISSSCVYGNNEVMAEDDVDFHPDTPYAITKLLGERYCKFWADNFSLNVVSLRFFNSYGPHEFPGQYRNVVPNFFKRAMAGKPLIITGTGNETRDFTFVQDTVSGVIGSLFGNTKPGDIFNIASGTETKIIDMATKINDLTQNTGGVEFLPRRSWDQVMRRKGVIEKAQQVFGYAPAVSFDEGLVITYEWLKSIDA